MHQFIEVGATEAFLIDKSVTKPYLLMLNNFTNRSDVNYKLIFEDNERESVEELYKISKNDRDDKDTTPANYIFDYNKSLILNSKVGNKSFSQKNLGIYKDKKFYFINAQIGQGITSRRTEYIDNYLKALQIEVENSLTINELLKDHLVDNENDAQIKLSFNNITDNTFIDLFSN